MTPGTGTDRAPLHVGMSTDSEHVDQSVAAIRRDLAAAIPTRIESGTVVRWTQRVRWATSTYAAVYAAGKWYMTSNGRPVDHDTLVVDFLCSPGAEDIQVATGWERVS